MRKRVKVTLVVLGVMGAALFTAWPAVDAFMDDGTVPAKITSHEIPRGVDKAQDERMDTGYMPVVGRDGTRVGVVKWADLTSRERGPDTKLTVYASQRSGELGEPVGTLGSDGFVPNQAAR